MSMGQIAGAIVVVGAFATLLAANGTQGERNAAAQAQAGQTVAVPAFSQKINAAVAAAEEKAAASKAATSTAAASTAAASTAAASTAAASGAATTPVAAATAGSPELNSELNPGLKKVSFIFPSSDLELSPGPNLELVQANCTACHSPGMILTQPKLTKATWTAEVNKMRQTYKAPVAEEDVEPIVAYLTDMPVPK